MQLNLNLASVPYVDSQPLIRRLRIVISALSAAIIVSGILFHLGRTSQKESMDEVEALDRTIYSDTKGLENLKTLMQRPENVLVAQRTSALNPLFDEKAFSWTLLMRNLEGVVPQGVQLASIEPIRDKGVVTEIHLHVSAPRAQAIEFLLNLERSSSFDRLQVLGESTKNDNHPNQRPDSFDESTMEDFDIMVGYGATEMKGDEPSGRMAAQRN